MLFANPSREIRREGRAVGAVSVSVPPHVPIETKPCDTEAVWTPSPNADGGETREGGEEPSARAHLSYTGEGKLSHHALARLGETSLGGQGNHPTTCDPFWKVVYSVLQFTGFQKG